MIHVRTIRSFVSRLDQSYTRDTVAGEMTDAEFREILDLALKARTQEETFPRFCTWMLKEVIAAREKWPDDSVLHRLAALSGEVGELAEGVLKQRSAEELVGEAVQAAAMAYRAAVAINRELGGGRVIPDRPLL